MEEKIVVNGVTYIREDVVSANNEAETKDGMRFCIIRTYSAGVFAGYLKERDGKECTLIDAIRIWYWSGACSLSQLAVDGPKNPEDCKFAVPVHEIILTEVIEVIPCTEKAKKEIQGVESWKK